MRRIAASLVILVYPLWSHIVIASGQPGWSLPGLAVLIAVALTIRDGALPRSPAAWVVITAFAAAGFLDLYLGTPFALYAPPILIPAFIAWVFGRTLLPGRRPMVQRFAEDVMNRDDPERLGYMRALTWFWTLLLAGLAVQALLLALFASPVTWSLFANGINYGIVVLAFIGEFLVRCARYGIRDQPGEFWIRLLQTDFRRLG